MSLFVYEEKMYYKAKCYNTFNTNYNTNLIKGIYNSCKRFYNVDS